MERIRIAVIGGGASGLMAALSAAQAGARVTVLEHTDRVGKKLLLTGNGRCNFTNDDQRPEHYRSLRDSDSDAFSVVQAFDSEKTIRLFEQLGVPAARRAGWVYPRSLQASGLQNALRSRLAELGCEIRCGVKIREIRKTRDGFEILASEGAPGGEREERILSADRVILCCGGRAAPQTGSDGSGYRLAEGLGHHITQLYPALTGLETDSGARKALAGVRAQARAALTAQGRILAQEEGEVQFTPYGVSGIVIFQLSRFAARAIHEGSRVRLSLDLLPETDLSGAEGYIRSCLKRYPDRTPEEAVPGLLPKTLWSRICRAAEESGKKEKEDRQAAMRGRKPSSDDLAGRLASLCKDLSFRVVKTCDYSQAQVTAGGVPLAELYLPSMQSRYVPGLYLAGEMLDVDGCCGGYNLQWAWSSGWLAGAHAAGKDGLS